MRRQAPLLRVKALERRYRQAHDPVARSHCQIVWLLARGQSSAQVAAITGYGREWVREVRRRYHGGGIEALGDQRHTNPGQSPMRDDALGEALSAALRGPALEGARAALTEQSRPLRPAELDLAGYTRTAYNEIEPFPPRLPNPTLVMYVFPHLTGSEAVPVTGYATTRCTSGSIMPCPAKLPGSQHGSSLYAIAGLAKGIFFLPTLDISWPR